MRLRAGVGGLLAVTLLLAFYLTAAPDVHALVHPDHDATAHVCVVTIFLSGGCESVWCDPVATNDPLAGTESAILQGEAPASIAPRRTSILEHAPPFLLLTR